MKLVFASDSFKGSLSSARIGELLEEAAREVLPGAECVVCPIADGGEGTLDAIARACEGERIGFPAHDGLMRPIEGEILVRDGKAFVEAASTCGLTLLEAAERDPLATTSYGVGECIRFALDRQCEEVVVGLGGSCTNDGGMGCLRALGVRFFDAAGRELSGRGADLAEVARIDATGLHPRAKSVQVTIMGDVDNPLLGPRGATHVFGRQKGADEAAIQKLESGMAHFAEVIAATFPSADFDTPGFGVAKYSDAPGPAEAAEAFPDAASDSPGLVAERGLDAPRSAEAAACSGVDFDTPGFGVAKYSDAPGPAEAAEAFPDAASDSPGFAAERGLDAPRSAEAAACSGVDFDTPGFGAAGGLGMALSVFLGARIRSGVEELLSLIDFDSAVAGADLVVTGEGRLDGQSLHGKAMSGVVAHARRAGVPVAAVCGTVALQDPELQSMGFSQVIDISRGQEHDYAMAHAEQNYREAARRLLSSLQMKIRKATERDLGRIMEVYAIAREFMARHGNPNQWGPTGWPPEALVRRDIASGKSYVCEHAGRIVGVFFFDFGPDVEPTYAHIEDGAWLDESPYGVVHRIASDGSVKGVGSTCINWAFAQCGHLRIDTHGDNVVMQRLLRKLGFTHCGTVFVEEDDYPRLAFEKAAPRERGSGRE